MTPWQAALQAASLLRGVVWNDPPGSAVFTRVVVSDDDEGNFLPTSWLPDGPRVDLLPFAKVWAVSVSQDNGSAAGGRTTIRLRVSIVAGGGGVAGAAGATTQQIAGAAPVPSYDSHGENQTLGTLRATPAPAGQGQSQGRDVDEIMDRVLESLNMGFLVDSVHGFQGFASETVEKYPVDGVQVLARVVDLEVHNGTRSRTYHSPFLFRGVAAGGGVVNLSWTAPPSRFDGPPVYVVRRGATVGASAPATIADGVAVTVVGTTAQATGLSAGVYNFSAFAHYGEVTTPDRTSPRVTCAVTAT